MSIERLSEKRTGPLPIQAAYSLKSLNSERRSLERSEKKGTGPFRTRDFPRFAAGLRGPVPFFSERSNDVIASPAGSRAACAGAGPFQGIGHVHDGGPRRALKSRGLVWMDDHGRGRPRG